MYVWWIVSLLWQCFLAVHLRLWESLFVSLLNCATIVRNSPFLGGAAELSMLVAPRRISCAIAKQLFVAVVIDSCFELLVWALLQWSVGVCSKNWHATFD